MRKILIIPSSVALMNSGKVITFDSRWSTTWRYYTWWKRLFALPYQRALAPITPGTHEAFLTPTKNVHPFHGLLHPLSNSMDQETPNESIYSFKLSSHLSIGLLATWNPYLRTYSSSSINTEHPFKCSPSLIIFISMKPYYPTSSRGYSIASDSHSSKESIAGNVHQLLPMNTIPSDWPLCHPQIDSIVGRAHLTAMVSIAFLSNFVQEATHKQDNRNRWFGIEQAHLFMDEVWKSKALEPWATRWTISKISRISRWISQPSTENPQNRWLLKNLIKRRIVWYQLPFLYAKYFNQIRIRSTSLFQFVQIRKRTQYDLNFLSKCITTIENPSLTGMK